MAEKSPKYYWLKLKDDFFLDKRVKKLRRSEAGDTAVIVYLKMMLSAMKKGGELVFEGIEDNYSEELALEIDEDEAVCFSALETLMRCGLVETADGKTFFLPEVSRCTGSESAAAERMRNTRKNRSEKTGCVQPDKNDTVTNSGNDVAYSGNIVEHCYTEIEIEKEKEIEIETKTESDKETENKTDTDIYSEKDEEKTPAAALPLRDKRIYNIYEKDISHWKSLYPKTDVRQEIRSMKGWLEANPEKLKDREEMPRFINAWLARRMEKLSGTDAADGKSAPPSKNKSPYPHSPSYDLEAQERKMMTSVPVLPPKKKISPSERGS